MIKDTEILFGVDIPATAIFKLRSLLKTHRYEFDIENKEVLISNTTSAVRRNLYDATFKGLKIIFPKLERRSTKDNINCYLSQVQSWYSEHMIEVNPNQFLLATKVHYVPTCLVITDQRIWYFFEDETELELPTLDFMAIIHVLTQARTDGLTVLTVYKENTPRGQHYKYNEQNEIIGVDITHNFVNYTHMQMSLVLSAMRKIMISDFEATNFRIDVGQLTYVVTFDIPSTQYSRLPLILSSTFFAPSDCYTCKVEIPIMIEVLATLIRGLRRATKLHCMSCNLKGELRWLSTEVLQNSQSRIKCWLCEQCIEKLTRRGIKRSCESDDDAVVSKKICTPNKARAPLLTKAEEDVRFELMVKCLEKSKRKRHETHKPKVLQILRQCLEPKLSEDSSSSDED